MADVFPKDSLQDRCRLNITNTYTTTLNLLARGSYELPTDYTKLFDDVSNFMTFPYGLMFNCIYSVDNVFFESGPITDDSFAG